MKKLLIIGLCLLLAAVLLIGSVVALYIGMVITNDVIAANVERELLKMPLPGDTILMDSVSIAGKLVGNGNGMQYMGSILVISHLSEEELYDYYSEAFDYVEVRKQETQKIDFINSQDYSFELFGDPNHHDHYSVTCWGSPEDVGIGGFLATVLLNFDLRGH